MSLFRRIIRTLRLAGRETSTAEHHGHAVARTARDATGIGREPTTGRLMGSSGHIGAAATNDVKSFNQHA